MAKIKKKDAKGIMIKFSKFNYLIKVPGKEIWALHNFLTGATAKLDIFQKALFERAPEIYDGQENIKQLIDRGFLVDYDEMRHLRNMALFMGDFGNVGATICPTLDCNFNCPYCFEKKRPGKMSPDIQEKVINTLKDMIKFAAAKKMQISWYGGEPSLCLDVIEHISNELIAFCEEEGVDYAATIITNGFILSEEVIRLYERCKINFIQITVDGPDAATHDATRALKSGEGSFDRIINNLKNIKTNIRIAVRCNVTKANMKDYAALYELVEEIAKSTGNNISAYPSRMRCTEKMDVSNRDEVKDTALDEEEYSHQVYENAPNMRKYDRKRVFRACGAQRMNNFVVDEKGNLYKCWEDVGRDEWVFSKVDKFRECIMARPTAAVRALDDYLETIWPDGDEECMSCLLLPLCMGGCPRARLNEGRNCLDEKYDIGKYVLALYENVFEKGEDVAS